MRELILTDRPPRLWGRGEAQGGFEFSDPCFHSSTFREFVAPTWNVFVQLVHTETTTAPAFNQRLLWPVTLAITVVGSQVHLPRDTGREALHGRSAFQRLGAPGERGISHRDPFLMALRRSCERSQWPSSRRGSSRAYSPRGSCGASAACRTNTIASSLDTQALGTSQITPRSRHPIHDEHSST